MSVINILVAEDTNLVRRLIIQQLSHEPDMKIIGEADNGREAVQLACELRPDIVLMDLDMPGLNGIEATGRILAQCPYIKVLLLTSHEALASMGRFAGAADYLNKNCTPAELTAAIRRVHAATAIVGTGSGSSSQATIERLAIRAALTDREKVVLEKLVNVEATIAQIASELSVAWKQPVSDSAVKHTIERIMNKMRIEPRTRASLVKHVLESGQSNL